MIEAKDFRGNFEELAAVMQCAWAANKEVPLLYTASFLRSALEYPGTDVHLCPSVYSEAGEVLAFVAGLPRRFRVNGKERSFLLTSFLTAAESQKGSGYGIGLWREIHERARRAGLDGALSLCVEGDGMDRIIASLARLFRFNTQRIFSVEYLTRFLRPARELAESISDREIDTFLELASAIPEATPFARLWSRNEAIWQCRSRAGAVAVTASLEHRRGMLTGYVVEIAGTPPVKALAIEDVLWGDLDPAERKDLLQRFLRAGASSGAQVASCPIMNYADLEPFRAGGFRASKRRVHVYLTTWTPFEAGVVPSVYLDVL